MTPKFYVSDLESVIRIFLRFLKEENIYHRYLDNIYVLCYGFDSIKSLHRLFLGYFIKKINKKTISTLIYISFYWGDTKEGYSFWNIYDGKWRKFCNKHIVVNK